MRKGNIRWENPARKKKQQQHSEVVMRNIQRSQARSLKEEDKKVKHLLVLMKRDPEWLSSDVSYRAIKGKYEYKKLIKEAGFSEQAAEKVNKFIEKEMTKEALRDTKAAQSEWSGIHKEVDYRYEDWVNNLEHANQIATAELKVLRRNAPLKKRKQYKEEIEELEQDLRQIEELVHLTAQYPDQ